MGKAGVRWCLTNLDTLRASVMQTSRSLYIETVDGVQVEFSELQAENTRLNELIFAYESVNAPINPLFVELNKAKEKNKQLREGVKRLATQLLNEVAKQGEVIDDELYINREELYVRREELQAKLDIDLSKLQILNDKIQNVLN